LSAGLMLYQLHTAVIEQPFAGANGYLTCFCAIAAILIIVRHYANIRRLFAGSEGHFKESALMEKLARITHVVALGFWFGGAAFFTFVATPIIFTTFDGLVADHA